MRLFLAGHSITDVAEATDLHRDDVQDILREALRRAEAPDSEVRAWAEAYGRSCARFGPVPEWLRRAFVEAA